MAARLAPGDTARTLRAYEVVSHTGRSLAEYQRAPYAEAPAAFVTLLFMPPRAALVGALDERCRRMIEAGALEEVRRLIALGLDPALPAMKALGVRELGRHIAGEIDLDTALGLFQIATRQYAKRQATWFRHQFAATRTWSAQYSESINEEMFSFIRNTVDPSGASV